MSINFIAIFKHDKKQTSIQKPDFEGLNTQIYLHVV